MLGSASIVSGARHAEPSSGPINLRAQIVHHVAVTLIVLPLWHVVFASGARRHARQDVALVRRGRPTLRAARPRYDQRRQSFMPVPHVADRSTASTRSGTSTQVAHIEVDQGPSCERRAPALTATITMTVDHARATRGPQYAVGRERHDVRRPAPPGRTHRESTQLSPLRSARCDLGAESTTRVAGRPSRLTAISEIGVTCPT